ncbi:hypothetical protein LJB97_05705 [Parabacteroides sp. OttesenSCG-928-O15]|nr:hypothetical protein [Parabacteroides sp. OttesenSCG-928-O15]
MIKHIFKQIWVEWRLNSWILLELTVVFFFLLIMTDFLWGKLKNYKEPKGFDIENTYLLRLKTLEPMAPGYVAPEMNTLTPAEEVVRLVERIRQYSDVEAVSVSMHASPYTRGGVWNGFRVDSIFTPIIRSRSVSPSYFDVFRFRTAAGEPIRVEEGVENQVILTKDMAELLFGNAAEAVGKDVMYSEDMGDDNAVFRVVEVSTRMKWQEFFPYEGASFEILTVAGLERWLEHSAVNMLDICVRVYPERALHFEESFESDMGDRLKENNLYVSSVVPSAKLRDNVVGKMLREDILLMTYVMIFVLITVFLGVFGSFWLRTRQRRAEIGIRMVAGATRAVIRKQMMIEGLLLIAIVIVPAFLVYINLLYLDALDTWRLPFTLGRVLIALFASLVIIVLMVLGGIYRPARGASNIQLAEVLKDE